MKHQLINCLLVASLLSITGFCSEIGVPVLLWQQKTDSHLFDSKSTVNQIDGQVLAEDYLTESQTIVAFVQNHLSLEQFTAEDEERLTAVKSIFKDQSIKPTLLTDVLNPTEALISNRFQHQKWDRIHVRNGDKVWVELPEDTLALNNQLLAQLMAEIQKNVSKSVLFMITGRQNQFQSIDLEPQSTDVHKRLVREVEQPIVEAPAESNTPYLVNINNCLYFYTTSITLNNITGWTKYMTKFNTSTPLITNSKCWVLFNDTSKPEPARLELKYDDQNDTDITLNLIIENQGNNYFWGLVNSTVVINSTKFGPTEFELIDSQIESEQSFGYSCTQLAIASKAQNITINGKVEMLSISLTFNNFQLQPFVNPLNNKGENVIFTDTFDCQVWMTLPLWMGLLTLILMFIILWIGVYFIAMVNTPDRFENPKAKPLIITAIED